MKSRAKRLAKKVVDVTGYDRNRRGRREAVKPHKRGTHVRDQGGQLSTAAMRRRGWNWSSARFKPIQGGPEALEWVMLNKNPFPFASNRFDDGAAVEALIHELYGNGAERVEIEPDSILSEPDRIQREGGPYADSLLIRAKPGDEMKMRNFIDREIGPDAWSSIAPRTFRVWWD